MAEIKIEKKAPIWPWILGLILIAGIVYYFMTRDNDTIVDTEITTVVTTDTLSVDEPMDREDAIASYVTYIDNPEMGVNHVYTNGGLHHLIDATRSAAEMTQVDIEANLTDAAAKADKITKNPESLQHADLIKDAAETITKALKTIQTEKFSNLDMEYSQVENAVKAIDVKKPTLEQKDAVNNFFNKAAILLTSIKNNYDQ